MGDPLIRWLNRLLGIGPTAPSPSPVDQRLAEFEAERERMARAASVNGSHYTDHVEQVKHPKRERRHDEAIALLLKLVDATEAEVEAAGGGWGVAPWYYEQSAIV